MRFDMCSVDHQPLEIRFIDEHGEQLLPNPFVAPTDEAPVRVAPTAIFRGQVTPGSTRAQDPNHRIDKPAVVVCDAAPISSFSGKMGCKFFPDVI